MEHATCTPMLDAVVELTERCDRCGAAARLTATLTEGGLAFCGHHANTYAGDILRVAVRVRVLEDFAWAGIPRPSTAAGSGAGAVRAPRPYRNSR
jgi:hypothetical protein